ncbi:hydrogenase nickel incorporation protein HypB [Desulfitobacterium hafniense]|uniref:Hydrogenase nickel incorporation protein HypB n=1 Tax=Desulfitobacterium hafniense TaxID=49338 RepID=A0A0W1JI14_DESHA|nr:hydrogenase nickel incorporation protein HypB [Desulfitobacterium hafniense]KTE91109.1 hydrogenase nickel incorporation protein HypB [Desulfitobacterium hafniense]
MSDIRLINIKEEILSDNLNIAEAVRSSLQRDKVFMLNLMASPGAGKTNLLLSTIQRLKSDYRIAVIEGDIDSMVDSEKIAAQGTKAVQLRTDGACHLDAPMIDAALQTLDLSELDLVFIENIGNLVCPAEFDTGAALKVMILSVPEGDDKVLKYPLMFSVCDVLLINKIDCLHYFDFDKELLKERVWRINPDIKIFEVSSKTSEGIENWCNWLKSEVEAYRKNS